MIRANGPSRTIALLILLSAALGVDAQAPASPRIGLRVQALTSNERDALNLQLQAEGVVRMTYACVPAGILVLETVGNDRSAAEARTLMMTKVTSAIAAHRILEEGFDQQSAEERCANARGE